MQFCFRNKTMQFICCIHLAIWYNLIHSMRIINPLVVLGSTGGLNKNKWTEKLTWQTSLISFILQPPLPISEPHWLAGTTRRMVTGGLLVAVLLVIEVLMSWRERFNEKAVQHVTCAATTFPNKRCSLRSGLTSSSFSMIIEKALKMEVVGPARVMILSGQFPSEMLMRAPLYKTKRSDQISHRWRGQDHRQDSIKYLFRWTHLFSHLLDRLSFL